MLTVSSLLLLFILTFKFLSSYIKKIRTGDPNESDLTYWMFSYDFKSTTKDWEPEEKNLLRRKRTRVLQQIFFWHIHCFFLNTNK